MVELKPVDSSNISAIGYDAAAKELHVQFSSGATYAYRGVPPTVYSKLAEAKSKGAHFAQHIRSVFKSAKV